MPYAGCTGCTIPSLMSIWVFPYLFHCEFDNPAISVCFMSRVNRAYNWILFLMSKPLIHVCESWPPMLNNPTLNTFSQNIANFSDYAMDCNFFCQAWKIPITPNTKRVFTPYFFDKQTNFLELDNTALEIKIPVSNMISNAYKRFAIFAHIHKHKFY